MTGSGENQAHTSHNYWRDIFLLTPTTFSVECSSKKNCFGCARKQTNDAVGSDECVYRQGAAEMYSMKPIVQSTNE